ncbi:MAG: RodZ domain-containing protein [Rhodospirillales bacterium]
MASPAKDDNVEQLNNAPGVGALLKASRLRIGDDLRDISGVLRIRHVFLEAIEDGRFDDLPGATYAKGFIRVYAEHLGLDSDEVVRRYKIEVSGESLKSELVFPEPIPEPGIPGGAVVFVGIVVAVVAYGAWYMNTSKDGFLVEMISPVPDRLAQLSLGNEKAQDGQDQKDAPDSAEPAASPETPAAEAPAAETSEQTAETSQPAPGEMTGETAGETAPEPPGETAGETETASQPAAESSASESPPETAPESTPENTPAPEFAAPAETAPEPTPESAPETAPAPEARPETAAAPAAEPAAVPRDVIPEAPPPVETPVAEQASGGTDARPAEAETGPVEIYPPEPAPPEPAPAETAAAPAETPPVPETPAAVPEPVPETPAPAAPVAVTAPAGQPKPPSESPASNVAQTPETASLTPAGADEGSIVIRAKSNSWIQVRDENASELLVTRLLRAGDSYSVPKRPGLQLSTGNAGALEILVDGEPVPSIGGAGTVRRKVDLDAEKLKAGTAVRE